MTRKLIRNLALCGALMGLGSIGMAATTLNGFQLYAVGETSNVFSTFDPSDASNTAHRMYDDGATAGDVTADDSLWTFAATGLTAGAVDTSTAWKMGGWDGVGTCAAGGVCWTEQAPNSGGNAYYWGDTTAVTFYFFDQNGSKGDTFLPDNDFVYTDATAIRATMIPALCGDLQDELSGGTDWNAGSSTLLLNDAGTNGDQTASDGVYSLQFSGLPIGGYNFKVVDKALVGNEFNRSIGNAGLGGDNIAYTQTAVDDVRVEVRASDGRYKITSLAPPPPAGTYAVCAGWNLSLDGTTAMTLTGGLWQRTFTVATPGEYYVRVLVSDGATVTNTYPSIGDGYIIKTTTAGESVDITLDTDNYTDTAYPDTNFIYANQAARVDFASATRGRVQFIGFLNTFGLSGVANDWDTAAPGAEGTETSAGSEVFRLQATATATVGAGVQVKAIGDSDDLAVLADVWDVQLGGDAPSGGLTYNGNNAAHTYGFTSGTSYAFWADAATGRIKVAVAASADDVAPLRSASSSVNDWAVYE